MPGRKHSNCPSSSMRAGENNNMRNFKDLRGRQRNAKSLKRNDGARKGILIAPSAFLRREILTLNFLTRRPATNVASGPRFAARMASRQALHLKLGKLAIKL